jgi:hypothetical protein
MNRKACADNTDGLRRFKIKRLSRWLALVFSGLVLFPSIGSTQAPYYAGKTITVIEGNSAVSGVDFYVMTI